MYINIVSIFNRFPIHCGLWFMVFNVAVSFIGGGSLSSQRIPPVCRKSLTNLSHNIIPLAFLPVFIAVVVAFIIYLLNTLYFYYEIHLKYCQDMDAYG
jgi:hypothetical protein